MTVRAFLSYSHSNRAEATVLYNRLAEEPEIDVTWDAIDLHPYDSPKSFMDSVRAHDAVVHLISLSFLTSKNCMRELLAFMKDDTERNHYRQRTVPIIIEDESEEIKLFETTGQLRLVDHWMAKKTELEEELDARGKEFGAALDEVRGDLTLLRDIAEQVARFVRTVTDNIYATSYTAQASDGFPAVIERLRKIGEESARENGASRRVEVSRNIAMHIRHPIARLSTGTPIGSPLQFLTNFDGEPPAESKRLVRLWDSIVIASENNPDQPEFPPFSPRFPATPSYSIHVPRLDRDILVKDESHNFTGSHKDRMAWEIVVYYKTIIEDMLSPHAKPTASLPSASIISNGSAALAIQVMLRCYGLPALKVLVDQSTDRGVIETLTRAGCEVFTYDLSNRELDSADVLELTKNENGFDVTSRKLVDPTRRTYYDWLAYEILNCGAKHVFIPVGTGDLFVNVLTVLRDELTGVTNDRRLTGAPESIVGLAMYGATASDRKTKMDKLYAAFRPTLDEARRVVGEMRERTLCGPHSDIYDVKEKFVWEALSIARANGIHCDESGIAGLSLLLQLSASEEIATDQTILVVNTGWMHLA